jgi:hypothetical protein
LGFLLVDGDNGLARQGHIFLSGSCNRLAIRMPTVGPEELVATSPCTDANTSLSESFDYDTLKQLTIRR